MNERDWLPWAVALGGVLAYDAALIRGGRASLSDRAGRHPVTTLTGLGLLGLHLLWWPERFVELDPFRRAARLIRRTA